MRFLVFVCVTNKTIDHNKKEPKFIVRKRLPNLKNKNKLKESEKKTE